MLYTFDTDYSFDTNIPATCFAIFTKNVLINVKERQYIRVYTCVVLPLHSSHYECVNKQTNESCKGLIQNHFLRKMQQQLSRHPTSCCWMLGLV